MEKYEKNPLTGKGLAKAFAKAKPRPRISNVVWRRGWAHLVIEVNHRQIWRSLHTRYADKARERASEVAWRLRLGEDPTRRAPAPAAAPLDGLIDRFLEARGAELRAHTVRDYRKRFKTFATWCSEHKISDAESLSAEILLSYRTERRAKHAAATAASDLRAVRAVFAFGRRMKWIRSDPFSDLPRAPRAAKPEKPIHPWRAIRKLLALARKTDLGPAIEVSLFTGMRAGEIAHLRWADVDLERGVIHVVNRPGEFEIKTSEARTIPLAAELRRRWKRKTTGRLWTGKNLDMLSKVTGNLCRKAGCPGGIHGLRHNWITYLLLAGYPLVQVMAWAGHSNLSTTQGYTHVRQQVAKADVEAFREAFGG